MQQSQTTHTDNRIPPPRIKRGGILHAFVRSSSDPKTIYAVQANLNDGSWHCQCEAAKHGLECRHIKQVLTDEKERIDAWAGTPSRPPRRRRAIAVIDDWDPFQVVA